MEQSTPKQEDKIQLRPITLIQQRPMEFVNTDPEGKDRGPRSLSELTPRQYQFVLEYLQGKSAYRAALNAGYTESVAATAVESILNNTFVKQEVNRRLKHKFAEVEVTVDRVLEETAMMGFANILDYIEVQEDGTFKVDLRKVERVKGAAIMELSYDSEGRPKIRLADKKGALELLARHLKMFNQTEEVSAKDGKLLTIQNLDALVQQVTINQTVNNFPQSAPRLESGQTIEALP